VDQKLVNSLQWDLRLIVFVVGIEAKDWVILLGCLLLALLAAALSRLHHLEILEFRDFFLVKSFFFIISRLQTVLIAIFGFCIITPMENELLIFTEQLDIITFTFLLRATLGIVTISVIQTFNGLRDA